MTKEGIFSILGISALLYETDQAVRDTAKRLMEYSPGSIRKSILIPLSKSKEALDIVVEQILNVVDEVEVGTLWFCDSEYSVSVRYTGQLNYEVEEVLDMIASWFLSRGCVIGDVYTSIFNPHNRSYRPSKIDLELSSKISA